MKKKSKNFSLISVDTLFMIRLNDIALGKVFSYLPHSHLFFAHSCSVSALISKYRIRHIMFHVPFTSVKLWFPNKNPYWHQEISAKVSLSEKTHVLHQPASLVSQLTASGADIDAVQSRSLPCADCLINSAQTSPSKNQCRVVFLSLTKYSSLIYFGIQHGLWHDSNVSDISNQVKHYCKTSRPEKQFLKLIRE